MKLVNGSESARSRRSVLLLIPHRVRDLEGHALLAYHLDRSHGIETHVCNLADFEPKLYEAAPDAVVLDYLGWSSKARHAQLARRLGMKVAVLPIAGLYETNDEHLRSAGNLTGAHRFVDVYLAWGEFHRRIIVSAGLFTPDQVHVTGCPRFDLYRAPYAALEPGGGDSRRALGIPQDAPLILWSTNTPNFARDRRTMLLEATRTNRLSRAEAETNLREEKIQFDQHAALIRELARRHPDWRFVIKVHPIEPVSSYRPLVEALPNVQLAFVDGIRGFLQACDVLVQRSCTTATEAWMLDKPVLELSVEGWAREWAPPEYLAGNHLVRGVDEAERAIAEYLSGRPIPERQSQARRAFLADCFGPQDGRAAERCAERIAALISTAARSESDRARTRAAIREALETVRREGQRRLSARVKRALGIPASVPLRFWKRRGAGSRDGALETAEREVTPEMVAALHVRFENLPKSVSAKREPRARL